MRSGEWDGRIVQFPQCILLAVPLLEQFQIGLLQKPHVPAGVLIGQIADDLRKVFRAGNLQFFLNERLMPDDLTGKHTPGFVQIIGFGVMVAGTVIQLVLPQAGSEGNVML